MDNENQDAHLFITSNDDQIFIQGNKEGLAQLSRALEIVLSDETDELHRKPILVSIGISSLEIATLDETAVHEIEQHTQAIKKQKGSSNIFIGCLFIVAILLLLMGLSLGNLANGLKSIMGVFF
jgi:hypothetical protein